MSCNWSGGDDLLGCLKTQLIPYSKLRVGDILSSEHAVQVARIEKVERVSDYFPRPGYDLYDACDNHIGIGFVEGKQFETHCWIVDRRALDSTGVQAALQWARDMGDR